MTKSLLIFLGMIFLVVIFLLQTTIFPKHTPAHQTNKEKLPSVANSNKRNASDYLMTTHSNLFNTEQISNLQNKTSQRLNYIITQTSNKTSSLLDHTTLRSFSNLDNVYNYKSKIYNIASYLHSNIHRIADICTNFLANSVKQTRGDMLPSNLNTVYNKTEHYIRTSEHYIHTLLNYKFQFGFTEIICFFIIPISIFKKLKTIMAI